MENFSFTNRTIILNSQNVDATLYNNATFQYIKKTIAFLVKINKITQESADEILNDLM